MQFPFPPYEGRFEATDQWRCLSIDGVDRPTVLPLRGLDRVPDGPPCPRRGEDITSVRPFLEPCGLVDGSARDERVPGHDLAGRETDAGGEARGAERHGRRDRA